MGLSFVTPLAYDFRQAFDSIRSYYAIADEIVLGVDAQRVSWSRLPFDFDMGELTREIRKLDSAGKVRVVEGNFHGSQQPMENDTLERCELSRQCAAGNWIVQIDADEILLNAAEFRDWLVACDPGVCAWMRWLTVFKRFGNTALVIHPANEWNPVATRLQGQYHFSRGTRQQGASSPLQLLHFSWGRTPAELREKLKHWSHSKDFDTEAFFRFWESVTLENYRQFRNIHPIIPTVWPGLAVAEVQRGR